MRFLMHMHACMFVCISADIEVELRIRRLDNCNKQLRSISMIAWFQREEGRKEGSCALSPYLRALTISSYKLVLFKIF